MNKAMVFNWDKLWENLKDFCERLFGYPRPIRIPIAQDKRNRFRN